MTVDHSSGARERAGALRNAGPNAGPNGDPVPDSRSAGSQGSQQATLPQRGNPVRPALFVLVLITVMALLFGVPAVTLLRGPDWPPAVQAAGWAAFVVVFLAFPVLMVLGHVGAARDWAARIADTALGVAWVLFTWSLAGQLLRLVLRLAGVADPTRSRITAGLVVAITVGLCLNGYREAMRVPRVSRCEVTLDRLGRDLDGTTVVVLTDTHYGPIDRAGWSQRVVDVINDLDADIVCHTGDIADGTPTKRLEQAAPLASVKARLARVYVTGNHEYFNQAQGWLDQMRSFGWHGLHNRNTVVRRGDAQLVIAGVDDYTAASSGAAGHRADYPAALAGVDPDLPVLLLAHQPKQVVEASRHQIDLQVSGHTHGGQIWPFHWLVRLDQPSVSGLSRHGERTQLYTSNGAGFWGPPLRIRARSEITLLTLRSPQGR